MQHITLNRVPSEILFRDKIATVQTLDLSADELISALLSISESEVVCILDSCRVGHLGSHLLIAGVDPVNVVEISDEDPSVVLAQLDHKLSRESASIFTLSYDFGRKLIGLRSQSSPQNDQPEPDAFIASFDTLIVHDYDTGETRLTGNPDKFSNIAAKLLDSSSNFKSHISNLIFEISDRNSSVTSNFKKSEYLAAIETIKERIRSGDTYQTNLTQQLTTTLDDELSPQVVFERLRQQHPAPFAAFIKRINSTVVSASPERFFRVSSPHVSRGLSSIIETSPIKGTRPRGKTPDEDEALRNDLLTSPKDRAENTMIVDLLRNDLGRVCEYGSVRVEKLCDLEEHPTLFHLVSTVSGELRNDVNFSEILTALFPCGSITGAPKISTMQIIDEIETTGRGLSMGAIGYRIPDDRFGLPARIDLSVAIRTMVIRDNIATFNVGGGIVIDSEPEKEYDESLLKAKALLTATNADSVAEPRTK